MTDETFTRILVVLVVIGMSVIGYVLGYTVMDSIIRSREYRRAWRECNRPIVDRCAICHASWKVPNIGPIDEYHWQRHYWERHLSTWIELAHIDGYSFHRDGTYSAYREEDPWTRTRRDRW